VQYEQTVRPPRLVGVHVDHHLPLLVGLHARRVQPQRGDEGQGNNMGQVNTYYSGARHITRLNSTEGVRVSRAVDDVASTNASTNALCSECDVPRACGECTH